MGELARAGVTVRGRHGTAGFFAHRSARRADHPDSDGTTCLRQEGRRVGLDNWARAAHADGMADSLKARVKEKLLRQLAEDGRHPIQEAEGDDPRLVSINDDLEALEQAEEGDPIVEELAERYWVP